MRKHRDIKLVTTKSRRHYLVSEQNYHTAKFFTENVLVIEMRKILMNKPVCLGLSILDLGKTVIHEFGMIMQNQNLVEIQNFVIWIQTASLFM